MFKGMLLRASLWHALWYVWNTFCYVYNDMTMKCTIIFSMLL